MPNNFYSATGLTGGLTGSLDSINGASLSDLDGAMIITADGVFFYILDEDSALAESSPTVISPDSNAGDKRWILVKNAESGNGHITIQPHAYDSIIQGTLSALGASFSDQLVRGFFNGTDADGDQVDYKAFLSVGTYTIKVLTIKSTTNGILEVQVDSVSAGTVDCYNGTTIQNFSADYAGVSVTTPGIKTISLLINGKNVSASNHFMMPSMISIIRTA